MSTSEPALGPGSSVPDSSVVGSSIVGREAPARPAEPSIGQLVAAASRDLSELVRDEVALAKLELQDTARNAGKGAGLFGAAGFLGLVALFLLSFAAVYLLVTLGLNTALSFLIIAVLYLIVAGALAFVGKRSLDKAKGPERTIRTVKDLPKAFKRSAA